MTTTGAPGQIIEIAAVPDPRRKALLSIIPTLNAAAEIVLTTHVNADGDGAGSEAALGAWLIGRGKRVAIANPTPFPPRYAFLLPEEARVYEPGEALDEAVREADLVVVLDTGEPERIGRVAKGIREDAVIVLDHHPPSGNGIPGPGVRDPQACATGEIVYDLLTLAGTNDWPSAVLDGLYAAVETDTGSFRFANASPRSHLIAADLIRRGVDAEEMYRRLHANVPLQRMEILRLVLDNLEVDDELPITWITIPRAVTHDMAATADDLDGIEDYARNIEGTEVALLFRETLDGGTKVSFRSNGDVDVREVAIQFGGGGHVKAAGAVIGGPIASTRPRVLDAVREAVANTIGGVASER